MLTPVALFIFNRPEHTEKCLQAIRRVKPAKLLVVGDGGRNKEDIVQVEATRRLMGEIDWECQLLTNYSESNLGCKLRVSSGLNWVFEQVEEAIILEDDCIPEPGFFHFCDVMLNRYRDDMSVMHIGGVNFQFGKQVGSGDYYFSKYAHIWGWATYRRSWEKYQPDIELWPKFSESALLKVLDGDTIQAKYWQQRFQQVFDGAIDTWDYQWQFAVWANGGKCIVPQKNLVKNIGFGSSATHTIHSNPLFENMQTESLISMQVPDYTGIVHTADNAVFRKVFMPAVAVSTKRRSILEKILDKLRKLPIPSTS